MTRQSIHLRMIVLLTLLVALFKPIDVSAQFSGSGQGTASDPYLIFNPVQLNQVRNYLGRTDVYFSLQTDIDLSQWIANNQPSLGWLPIGTQGQPFKGTFKGNGHTVKGLKINRTSTSDAGFFGAMSGASISDFTVEGNVSGNVNVGLLCGYTSGTTFTGIVCRGNVTASGKAGLLIGASTSHTVTNAKCYGEVTSSGDDLGGVIGAGGTGDITGAEFYGKINGVNNLGGIVGNLDYKHDKDYYRLCNESYG